MNRVAVAVGLLALTGCSGRNGQPVEYVVPRGHVGPLWLVEDPAAPGLPVVNGKVEVAFPASGILRVPSMLPFEQWHGVMVRYDDGSPLRHEFDGRPLSPTTAAFRGGWRSQTFPDKRDYIVWVVGTEEAARTVGQGEHAPPAGQ